MNRISSIFFNKIAFCLSIALIGTLIGLFVEKKAHKSPDVAEFAASLETALHQSEEELERMFNNGSFLLNAVEGYVLSDTCCVPLVFPIKRHLTVRKASVKAGITIVMVAVCL